MYGRERELKTAEMHTQEQDTDFQGTASSLFCFHETGIVLPQGIESF